MKTITLSDENYAYVLKSAADIKRLAEMWDNIQDHGVGDMLHADEERAQIEANLADILTEAVKEAENAVRS